MAKLKKYGSRIGTRVKKIIAEELKVLATRAEIHSSDLLRECIECLLKNRNCKVRKKYSI